MCRFIGRVHLCSIEGAVPIVVGVIRREQHIENGSPRCSGSEFVDISFPGEEHCSVRRPQSLDDPSPRSQRSLRNSSCGALRLRRGRVARKNAQYPRSAPFKETPLRSIAHGIRAMQRVIFPILSASGTIYQIKVSYRNLPVQDPAQNSHARMVVQWYCCPRGKYENPNTVHPVSFRQMEVAHVFGVVVTRYDRSVNGRHPRGIAQASPRTLVGFTVATASGHLSQSKHSLGIELSKACDRLPQAMPHLIGVDGRQAFQRVEGRLVRFFAQLLESFLNLGYNSLQVWVSKPFRLARHGLFGS